MNAKPFEVTTGKSGMPLVKVHTLWSAAEIYLHGAHVTHFQKNGEPPLLFMSAKSHFAASEPIRGGVPVILPWFGSRDGEPSHGFARIAEWQLIKTFVAYDGAVTLHFALPQIPGREAWKNLRVEFVVTVAETLTMELVTANDSCDDIFGIENCLHTYFQVGDIGAVSIMGLEGAAFLDFAAGDTGTRKPAENSPIKIERETNRTYIDTASAVKIHDKKFKRIICVEKLNSNSTVVWNPWTTQKMPDDFDPAEHSQMVCVESGNVKQNKISLAPGKSSALKVVLSGRPI